MHIVQCDTKTAGPRRTFSPRSSDGCSSAARYCSGSPLAPSSLAANMAAETVVAGEQPDRRQAWAKHVLPFLFAQAISLVGLEAATKRGSKVAGAVCRRRTRPRANCKAPCPTLTRASTPTGTRLTAFVSDLR